MRLIDYCCPEAVDAYPAPCPVHGQDRPDIATVPSGAIVAPGGWCLPSEEDLPGPLAHYYVEADGTTHMLHAPQTHPAPKRPNPVARFLSDVIAGLRTVLGLTDQAVGMWAQRIVYDVHRPTYLPGYSADYGPAQVFCCHCSRSRDAVPWPCDPVLKVTP